MADLDVELPLVVASVEVARGAERSIEWNDGHGTRSVHLRLPVAATSGTRLRFPGQGRSDGTGRVGDLYLRLEVQPDRDRRATIGERSSRLAGLVLLALGVVSIAWTEYSAHAEGTYHVAATLLGPLVSAIGVGVLIHAPRLPILRVGRRENLYALAGALLGGANLYRFGAFDAGSEARLPLLMGVAALGLYSIYRWIRPLSSK